MPNPYQLIHNRRNMDDKQFDESMQKYVKSTSKGMDADFAKLIKNQQHNRQKYSSVKFLRYVIVSCVVIITIVLSIVLPIILSYSSTNNIPVSDEISYYESSNIQTVFLSSSFNSLDQYNVDIVVPKINYLESNVSLVILNNTETVLGFKISLSVYDELFDTIDYFAIYDNYVIDTFSHYHNMTTSFQLNDLYILYEEVYDEDNFYYICHLLFNHQKMNYYVSFIYYEDYPVNELITLIFNF